MRIGINTLLWTPEFRSEHYSLLPRVKAHGFDGVEITLIRAGNFDAPALRRALAQNGLDCTVCSVVLPDLSLIADDADIRRRTVSFLSDRIKITAELGATLLAGPLYCPVGFLPGRRRTRVEWERAVDGYRQLGPVLQAYGVELCLEPLNRFETFFLNTTEDAAALCEEVGDARIGILWDSFHANIEEKHLGVSLEQAAKHVKHVHACENDRGIPGTGHVDWPAIFSALAAVSYDGWLTIESFGFTSGDLAAAACIWRDLAASPEDIAWRGVEFLRSMIRSWNDPG